jgi:transcriptional regulator with XRE-family HTH domain
MNGVAGTLDVRVETFGGWLRPQVWQRGIGVNEFARMVGVRQSTVSEWFNTERSPRPQHCYRIAEVLGLDLNDVLRHAGHPTVLNPPRPDGGQDRRPSRAGDVHPGAAVLRQLGRARLEESARLFAEADEIEGLNP